MGGARLLTHGFVSSMLSLSSHERSLFILVGMAPSPEGTLITHTTTMVVVDCRSLLSLTVSLRLRRLRRNYYMSVPLIHLT